MKVDRAPVLLIFIEWLFVVFNDAFSENNDPVAIKKNLSNDVQLLASYCNWIARDSWSVPLI